MTSCQPQPFPAFPIRIKPRPLESFHGYVQRTATFYGILPLDVLVPMSERGHQLFQSPTSARRLGLTATPTTLDKVMWRFSLTWVEASRLFLNRYHGFLQLTRREVELLDPFTDTMQRRSPLHPERGVHTTRRRFRCISCQAEDPTRWDLSWLLTFHTICVEHHEFLVDAAEPDQTQEPASDRAVAAQQQVLDALADPAANRVALNRWAAGIAGKGIREPLIRQIHRPKPLRPLSRLDISAASLIGYARRSGHDPQGPEVTEMVFGPEPVLAAKVLRYDDPPIVANQPATAEQLERLPMMMPTRFYYGDLSDLSYPIDLRRGRLTASACVDMYLGYRTVTEAALRFGARRGIHRATVELLCRLEREGRLERYWDGIATAAEQLLTESIDYPQRLTELRTGRVLDLLRRQPPGNLDPEWPAREWVADRWVNVPMDVEQTLAALAEELDGIDLHHGTQLHQALAPLDQTIARVS